MRLLVGPVYTKAITEDKVELEALDNLLRVRLPNYWFSKEYKKGRWDGYIRFFYNRGNVFPTGFLSKVLKAFPESIVEGSGSEVLLKVAPSRDMLAGVTLRDDQYEILLKSLEKGRGILNCAVNSGKTEVAIALLLCYDMPALYLVHRRDLLYQTVERFAKRVPGRKMGVIAEDTEETDEKFICCTVQTLISRFSRLKEVFRNRGVLILDETHRYSARGAWFKAVMKIQASVRFGMTGSLYDEEEDPVRFWRLAGATGESIGKIKSSDLIREGISARPDIFFLDVPTDGNGTERPGSNQAFGNYSYMYKVGIVENSMRNAIVADVVELFTKKGIRSLVLCSRVEHGRGLVNEIKKREVGAIFLSGETDPQFRRGILADLAQRKLSCVVATTIFDEGIDSKEIEAVILAGGGKSKIKTIQRVGRGMRKKLGDNRVFIIDFIDNYPYLRKHSLRRRKVYEDEGFSVSELVSVEELRRVMNNEEN